MNKTINKKFENSQGQIVLVVLLVSALVLTMGLSISKKTVTETKIDTDEELLKQTFNTAESGIEYYLKTGVKQYAASDNSNATITVDDIGKDEKKLESEGKVISGDSYLFWLVPHKSDGSVDMASLFNDNSFKISVDSDFGGALKIDLFTYSGGNYSVSRSGFNFKNSGVVSGFANKPAGETFVNLNIAGGLLLSVTPIGGDTKITMESNVVFPSQGQEIVSVGQMESGVNTKVRVINKFEVPVFMLEAMTSGGSVLSQ